jgi:hypothetical protein
MKNEFFSVIRRAFLVWLVIVFAESLHGTIRVIFLQPILGDFAARQVAVFSGTLIILTIACFFVRWIRAKNNSQLFLVGLMWVLLTVGFEISLGRAMNFSWERIFSDYDVANGGLMGFGLLFMIFAPLIAEKLRNRFSPEKKILNSFEKATPNSSAEFLPCRVLTKTR